MMMIAVCAPEREHGGSAAAQAPNALASFPTGQLADACAREFARYLRHEPSDGAYSFELFRRAIVERDESAWAHIYAQYGTLVRGWLDAPVAAHDELVADTFARFWRAVDAAKFARFGTLAAVVQYLKLCAQAARLDRLRRLRRRSCEEGLGDTAQWHPVADDIAQAVVDRADGPRVWREVCACVTDERSRRVLYLSYVVGLRPREICAYAASEFPDVGQVYSLKGLALERLRRAPGLLALRRLESRGGALGNR